MVVDPDFWNDHEAAQIVLKEKTALANLIALYTGTQNRIADSSELFSMALEENDTGTMDEIDAGIDKLFREVDSLEVKLTLSGEYDKGNAIVTVKPGAGGTESQDWAQMLFRMYMRFAEKSGLKASVIDFQPGEEAGIKSVTITISGDYAYGYLKAEEGIHRLVRISPFDSNKRRHTSFASVALLPELNEDVQIDIDDGDLRVDTYRASGAGGQHVNKTDSAVRITHTPTGIVVQCQSERSQHKNRATAMKILKARLYEEEEKKKRKKIDSLASGKKEIGFGSQIRSYVLQPYRMVKDLRTNIETSNTDAVLDGDIMPFIEAYLSSGANRPATKTTEGKKADDK
jgi:peptide chain release factor 2